MKIPTNLLSLQKLTTIILLLLTFNLLSCQQKEKLENFEKSTVNFRVNKINTTNVASIQNKISHQKQNTHNSVTEKFEDFNMETHATSASNDNTISHPSYLNNNSQISKANKLANTAATQMPIGNKYMLFIYAVSGQVETFVSRHEVTVGTTDFQLLLTNNNTYNWYAFSYNQTASIDLTGIDNNNPEIPSKTDAPLLMDNGSFTLNTNNGVNQDILFEHQTYKIELQVDVLQFFATSQTISAAFDNQTLTTNNYNLKTKSISGEPTSVSYNNPITFTNGMFNNTITPTIKNSTNIIYTSQSNPNITVDITSLSVTKNGVTNVAVITSSTPVPITNFVDNSDMIKRGVVNIIEKSIDIPPLSWGQGNLYYDDTDLLNPYKFGPARQGGDDAADECKYYWNWNSIMPRYLSFPSTLNDTGDPCKQVLPKNTWRTPTVEDYEEIVIYEPQLVSVSESTLYLPLPGNVRLYFWDNGTSTDDVCDIGNIDDGQYWTSSSESTNRGIILYMDGGPDTWIRVAIGSNLDNYDNRDKDQGRPVRCVKNVTP